MPVKVSFSLFRSIYYRKDSNRLDYSNKTCIFIVYKYKLD